LCKGKVIKRQMRKWRLRLTSESVFGYLYPEITRKFIFLSKKYTLLFKLSTMSKCSSLICVTFITAYHQIFSNVFVGIFSRGEKIGTDQTNFPKDKKWHWNASHYIVNKWILLITLLSPTAIQFWSRVFFLTPVPF